jgi:hypothetical protein
MRFSVRGPHTCSIMSHSSTRPASSRSEFVIVPFGLALDFTLAVMSGGHCSLNTVGRHSDSSAMMTPPTPWLDASTTPIKSGQPTFSLRQRVGRLVDSRKIVRQFDIAACREALRWKYTTGGRLHGERSPRLPGRAVNTCRSFAITDSNSPNRMPRLREPAQSQLWRMVRSFALFSSSNHIVFCLPSKSKPRSVLKSKYCPSPFNNFFSEIGSLLSTMSAGKTSWMPVIIAVATCSNCSWDVGMTMLMKSSTQTSRA